MECPHRACSEHALCGTRECTCQRLEAAGVTVIEGETPGDLLGWYDADAATVTIKAGLPWPVLHSTLAHEAAHVELGDVPRRHWWGTVHIGRMEDDADELAARDLIPLPRLGKVLRDAESPDEVAERLDVDRTMVEARLACLRPAERRYLDEVTHPLPRQRASA